MMQGTVMTDQSTSNDDDLLAKTLTAAGWKKTVKGERLGKADFEYDNGEVTLEVEAGSEPGSITFSIFDSPEEGSDFVIKCEKKLPEILAAVISFQDKISFD